MTDHKPGCMALQAWDEPGACTCASLPESSPPQVSDRMRELVEAACDWEWTTGKYTGQHASTFTQQRSTEEAAAAKEELLREIAALEAKTTWQPIETAPEEGAWAFVLAHGAVNCAFVRQGCLPEDWTQPAAPNIVPEDVTHWMLPPEAPHA